MRCYMKGMLKKISMGLMAVTFVFVAVATSHAGAVRCVVDVKLVGATTGASGTVSGYKVLASKAGGSCPGWGTRTSNNFNLQPTNADGMLATILTAVSLGRSVAIHSPDDTFPNGGLVEQVYMENN